MQHAAGDGVLLEYRGTIAHSGEIIGAAQARRATADDGNFLVPTFEDARRNIDFRHEAVLCMQVLFGDEFLHGVDGYGLVNGAAGAGVLTAAVADTAADGGERVLTFDELQCLAVFPFGGFLQVTLHGDMRRTGGLAWRSARGVAVDTVLVAVVLVPFMRTPFLCVGQLLLGISLLAVLGAKLLSQTDGSGGTVFHTAAAGYAILRLYFGHIGATAHVGCVEEL